MFTYGREKACLSAWCVAQYALAVAALILAMLIYIYPSIRATSLMYEYAAELERFHEARELNKKLKLEVSTLRSYDLIERRAMDDLGFVFPAPGQVVIIAKK